MPGNGWNGLMAGKGWTWLERAESDLKWLEWLDMVGNGRTLLEVAGMACNGWKCLEMVGNGYKWLK